MKYIRTQSGLLIAAENHKQPKYLSEYKQVKQRERRVVENYKEQHKYCPNCYSDNFEELTQGGIVLPEDLNPYTRVIKDKCTCLDCGWEGIVHDRVSYANEGQKAAYIAYEYKKEHRYCPDCGSADFTKHADNPMYCTEDITCDGCGMYCDIEDRVPRKEFEVWRAGKGLENPFKIGTAITKSFHEACWMVIDKQGWINDFDDEEMTVFGLRLGRTSVEAW